MKILQKEIEQLLNLYKSKKLIKAENLNRKLIHNYPKVVILYNILGLILTEQNRVNEAIEIYEKGIKFNPEYAMIYNNLGSIYKSKAEYKRAENYYKKSISLDNKISEPHNNLGSLYLTLNKIRKAELSFKRSLAINSKFYISYYNLGILYKNLGKFDEAKVHLQKSIELNTNFYSAHRTLSQLIKYKKDDDHLALLEKIYHNSKKNNEQNPDIIFALGKAMEDIKDYDNSFKYYKEANNLRRKQINFSVEKEKNEFDNIKKIFNENLFKKYANLGNLNSSAIFIVGMPRSGTTLVEQIISSHPKVFGGDELYFLPDLIKNNFCMEHGKLLLKQNNNIKKKDLKLIGQKYINDLIKISNKSEKVTDKLPINFKWIGLIKLILPNSIIIHCVRNSKDNCLSIFKNFFANKSLNFAYKLDEITDYYYLYHDLIRHWKKTLPKFIVDIEYEQIIENPEQQIRNLIEKCNLDWNKNCLKFYENKRLIKTASDIQARKKIYKSSINSWKNYKKNLQNSFQKLPD